jgi:signal peptidase I
LVFDFSFVLVTATVLTGLIWGLDTWVFRRRRLQAAAPADAASVAEPVVVEYARSFFPIILIVLMIRSFLFEPFRIPSDSMMPTLLDGDFIFVNKFTYGLRLPVVNTKIVALGDPQRGDVVVFRLPSDPATNYIKRLVGLPGDHIVVRDKRVYVNDVLQDVRLDGMFEPFNSTPLAQVGVESLGDREHRTLYIAERPSVDFDDVVPAGHYFFMGDNRDNSRDSRFPEVGFVPADNVVGRAVRIWLNWNLPHAPIWGRIGSAIR